MAEDQERLQTLTDRFQKLQEDHQSNLTALQTLTSQRAENAAVQREFASLPIESNIYKLVGPILLKQERSDAISAVNGRLEFIEKEIQKTEERIKELQDGSDKVRGEIGALQARMAGGQVRG